MKKGDDTLFYGKVVDWFLKWKRGRRFICASTVFPFGQSSPPNLPHQESFDHPKGGYVHGLWENVF